MAILNQKDHFRKWWKEHYPHEEGVQNRRSQKVIDLLLHSEFFLESPLIGLFVARPWEINLLSLWSEKPTQCVFPKVRTDSVDMDFYRIGDLRDLKPGFKGILEPEVTEGFKVLEWPKNSIILVPGFAFDVYGGRIGSGLGYYDRYLANFAQGALKWGVCFKEQIQKEKLAQEITDVRMDAIISDEGFLNAEK